MSVLISRALYSLIAKLHRMFLEAHDPDSRRQRSMQDCTSTGGKASKTSFQSTFIVTCLSVNLTSTLDIHEVIHACDVCDSLKLQMEQASESEKAALQKKHEDHLA